MDTWTWRGTTWPGGTGRIEVGDIFGSAPNTFTITSILFPWPTYSGFFCEITGITPTMNSVYTAASGRKCSFSGSYNYTRRCIVNAVTVEDGYNPSISGIGTNWQSQIYQETVTQPYTGTLTPVYSPYDVPSYTFDPVSRSYADLITQGIDDGFIATLNTPGKAGLVNTWKDGTLIRLEFSQASPTAQWYHVYGGETLETLETIDEYVRHTEALTAAVYAPGVNLYYWRVDSRILVESGTWLVITGDVWEYSVLPGKPGSPSPAHESTEVDWTKELSWGDGGRTDTYDIYFGLTGALALISSAQTETSITVDDEDTPFPEEGESGAAFYWRVDATNSYGTTTGDVWWFDPRPVKVTNPVPVSGATEQNLNIGLSWDASAVANLYNLYVGIGDWDITIEDLTELEISWLGEYLTVGYNTDFQWRVDSVNDFGTTTGDTWTFTTLLFDPPLPHYTLVSGDPPDYSHGDGINYGGTDWYWDGYNFIRATGILVVAAKDTIYYEENP